MGTLCNNGNNLTTMTTSAGTVSETFSGFSTRRLVQLLIKPKTSDTQYDIKIVEKNGLDAFHDISLVGKQSFYKQNLPEYIYGNFTITIENATNDEDFSVLPVFSEEI